jgi:hypothetical protein
MNVYRTFLSHRGPIHDIQLIPNSLPVGLSSKPNALETTSVEEGLTKFVTCSSDRTIRFWHHLDQSLNPTRQTELTKLLARNAYCREMSKIVFVQTNPSSKMSMNSESPQTPTGK